MAPKPGPEQHHVDALQSAFDGANDPNAELQEYVDQRAAELDARPDADISPAERTRRNGELFAKALGDSFVPDPEPDDAA